MTATNLLNSIAIKSPISITCVASRTTHTLSRPQHRGGSVVDRRDYFAKMKRSYFAKIAKEIGDKRVNITNDSGGVWISSPNVGLEQPREGWQFNRANFTNVYCIY